MLEHEGNEMKLLKKATVDQPEAPPGVIDVPGDPFFSRAAARVWARGGSVRGRYEVVIELDDGRVIKGAMKLLPGFFDAATDRWVPRVSLPDWKPRTPKKLPDEED